MSAAALVRAERISVRYGQVDALHPITIVAEPASLTLVLGPNGAGKTTLVKALAGAVVLRSGRVWLGDRDISLLPAHRRVRAGIALVPEGRGRLPGLSVFDNLVLGWHAAARERREARDSALDAALQLFPVLGDRLGQDCSTLSGGEMQMLAIARALLAKPQVLLLDEPSLGLAPIAVTRVYEALATLLDRGLSMVLVEQKAVPLRAGRESTIVLQNGRAVFQEARRPTVEELASLYLGGRAA
jgi:branched-chain amino acid transport system ATP-binding protein